MTSPCAARSLATYRVWSSPATRSMSWSRGANASGLAVPAVRAFVTAITVISTNVARLQLPGTSGGGLPPRRIHGEAQCWCDATQIEIPHCGDVGGRAGHCGRTHGGRTAISDLHKPEHIGDDMRLARQCVDQRL